MKIFHKELQNRWKQLSIFEQMANIGAEVGRAISWRKRNNQQLSQNAFYRALELLDFTIDDRKNKNRLREILRVREMLVDYLAGENLYQSTDEAWEKYFYFYAYASRRKAS